MLVKTKKKISMNYGSSTSSWRPRRCVRFDLILTIRDIYIIPTWTHSHNLLAVAKTIPISMRIVISYAVEWGILFWVLREVNGNWDNGMIRISNGWKVIVEQTLASEEINKSKRAALRQSVMGVGKLTILVRSLRQK